MGVNNETLVVPISGSLSPEQSIFYVGPDYWCHFGPPAEKNFWNVTHSLRDSGLEVADVITLPNWGIVDPNDTMEYLETKLDDLWQKTHRRAWLIGHSLGGTFVNRFVVGDPDRTRILGGIDDDTPNGYIDFNANPMLKAYIRFANFIGLVRTDEQAFEANIDEFNAKTWKIAAKHPEAHQGLLHFLSVARGNGFDFVSRESALHPVPGATLHALVPPPTNHLGNDIIVHNTRRHLSHVEAIEAKEAALIIRDITLSSLGALAVAA